METREGLRQKYFGILWKKLTSKIGQVMFFITKNKRLKQALAIENQGKRHKALTALAQEIGVSVLLYKGGARGYGPADETALVDRIRDAIRTETALCTALVAVVSAITALLSAIAAWWAVISR